MSVTSMPKCWYKFHWVFMSVIISYYSKREPSNFQIEIAKLCCAAADLRSAQTLIFWRSSCFWSWCLTASSVMNTTKKNASHPVVNTQLRQKVSWLWSRETEVLSDLRQEIWHPLQQGVKRWALSRYVQMIPICLKLIKKWDRGKLHQDNNTSSCSRSPLLKKKSTCKNC